jgi:hypothetical protein
MSKDIKSPCYRSINPSDEKRSKSVEETFNWIKNFLGRQNKSLGREGVVCPFILKPLTDNHLRYIEIDFVPSNEQIFNIIETSRKQFQSYSHSDQAAFMIIFSKASEDWAKNELISIQKEVKSSFIKEGLMIGEFYKTNSKPGLHNKDFRPLTSPIPMLTIRTMNIKDITFLFEDVEDSPTTKLLHLECYQKVFLDKLSKNQMINLNQLIADTKENCEN